MSPELVSNREQLVARLGPELVDLLDAYVVGRNNELKQLLDARDQALKETIIDGLRRGRFSV